MVNKEAIDTTKLQLIRPISSSDNTTVSLCRDTVNNKHIIVKRGKPAEAEYMRDEASIMENLDHPNIVKCYGFAVSVNSIPRIFMEYISFSLDKLLKIDEKLNDSFVDKTIVNENHWKIAMGIAAGLRYLHSQLIVHCDIKPGNILAMHDYSIVKICDFGLSNNLRATDIKNAKWDKGTAAWIAPEIAAHLIESNRPLPVTPYQIDIWALGQILLQLYINTGGKPYQNVPEGKRYINLFNTIHAGKHDPIPVDKPLSIIIAGCLIKNPAERFDAEKVVESLNKMKNPTI